MIRKTREEHFSKDVGYSGSQALKKKLTINKTNFACDQHSLSFQ